MPAYQRVKLQRAEAAPIKSVAGLFGTVLYVDTLQTVGRGAGVVGRALVWGVHRTALLLRATHPGFMRCSRPAIAQARAAVATPALPQPPPAPSPPSPQGFTPTEKLKAIFSEYGEVVQCSLPRSPTDPSRTRGFAFVGFKHSFAADA